MYCLPIGEHTEVPLADLVHNAAVQYLLTKPTSKPRWCLRKAPHDVTTCTFLHRTPEKAAAYVTVRGEPAPVSISDLLPNKGLEIAMAHPEVFAEWCSVAAPHEVATCKNIHLGEVKNDKTVTIEGEEAPVNVSHLLLNRGVSYLLSSHGTAKGVWCNNKIVHDVLSCPYIHRRIDDHPQVVNVDGEKFPVPVKDLVKNKGLEFLLENPQYSGRWCSLFEKHAPEDCGYLHRLHPFVRVDGETIRVSLLKPNRGLKYVLEHPEAHGHWCRSKHDETHPVETCTFIHYKDETRDPRNRKELRRNRDEHGRDHDRESRVGGGRGGGGGGDLAPPPRNTRPRTPSRSRSNSRGEEGGSRRGREYNRAPPSSNGHSHTRPSSHQHRREDHHQDHHSYTRRDHHQDSHPTYSNHRGGGHHSSHSSAPPPRSSSSGGRYTSSGNDYIDRDDRRHDDNRKRGSGRGDRR